MIMELPKEQQAQKSYSKPEEIIMVILVSVIKATDGLAGTQ